MKVIVPGHTYALSHLDGNGTTILSFVDRGHGHDHEGPTCQEVIRVLLDRLKFLDAERAWSGNADIRHHLRMALVGFEARALIRNVEKGEIDPEAIPVNTGTGHWELTNERR